MTAFHLAIPVQDLDAARDFYHGLLQCPVGRSDQQWIDFNFFGHQLTVHLASDNTAVATNPVDGEAVPVRHFGVILEMQQWRELVAKLRAAGVQFLIEPQLRFAGQPGEQATFFILDPSRNALEFKAFEDHAMVFRSRSKA